MASYFSVIPIRWLLTVDSEMYFFLFHSLAEGVLVTGLPCPVRKCVLFVSLFFVFFRVMKSLACHFPAKWCLCIESSVRLC